MAIPLYYDDGDFRSLAISGTVGLSDLRGVVGEPSWSFPFVDRGDNISWECEVTFRQDQAYFRTLPKMQQISTIRGIGYLVDQGRPRGIGLGLLEWTCTFASLPLKRTEFTNYVYPFQFYSETESYDYDTPPAAPTFANVPFNVSAEVLYEYFLKPPKPQVAPKGEVIFGTLFTWGDWGQLKAGDKVLAEDSCVEIYKATIYVRRGIYITWPNVRKRIA